MLLDTYTHQEWRLRRDLLQSYFYLMDAQGSVIEELSHSVVSSLEVDVEQIRNLNKSCPVFNGP